MPVEHFGAVRFDMDDPHAGGWASVAGQEAYRVANIGSLDNRTIWWSNLSFDAMFAANVHRLPHVKRNAYLHSWRRGGNGQDEFCQSWGLVRRSFTEKAITEALASIFDQGMRFAVTRYGFDLRAREVLAYDSLADEIRAKLLPKPDPTLGPEVDSAVSDAHVFYNRCMTPIRRPDDYVDVCFSRPAVAYAQEMTSTIIPSDQCEYLDGTRLPLRGQRLDWVLGQPRPVLARVTVSDVAPDFTNLICFGNGTRAGANRQWLTQPEILLLANFSRVEIESCFLFSEYRELPPQCRLKPVTDLQAIMPTAQILATNHWVGLCRENPYKLEPTKGGERRTSPRAAWLTAVDRFNMFTAALQMHQAGYAVVCYGAGSVIARVPRFNYGDAYEIAKAIGLLAPTTMSEDIEIQEDLRDAS